MAFIKDKTTAAQTSANVAGVVTSALIAKGLVDLESAGDAVTGVFEALFERLGPVVDADNQKFAAEDNGGGGGKYAAKSSGSSSTPRSSKTGGGSKYKGKSGGSGKISDASARTLELSWGSFEGVELGTLLSISAEDAEKDFGYGDGERSGTDYLTWLASDGNKNEFVQSRARVILDAEGIEYEV